MAYTVKKLAAMSGVSVRTLHFYDEIGLLKPAYIGENNYRYYQEEQLLMLQQILFYREIGMPLAEIQQIVTSSDFDKVAALIRHQAMLEKNMAQTQTLLQTIAKTIARIRGEITMKDEELYYGFDSEIQKQHEKTLVEKGIVTQEFLDEANAKTQKWTDDEKRAFIRDSERIMNEIIAAMTRGAEPASVEVQELMRQHYEWLKRSWFPTREKYLGLIELYHGKEFRVFFDTRHPDLLEFMSQAMRVFAERELS